MSLEVLERIADQIADLPQQLAALWEGEAGTAAAETADAEALGVPTALPVPAAPDWVDDPALPQTVAGQEREEEAAPAALAAALPWPEAEPPVADPVWQAWPDAEESPAPAPAQAWPETEEFSLPAQERNEPVALPSLVDPVRQPWPDAKEPSPALPTWQDWQDAGEPPFASPGPDDAVSTGSPQPIAEVPTEAEALPPVTAPPPPSFDFDGPEPLSGPAAETPGAGGSDLSRMVALLERIATAVEALQRGSQATGATQDSGQSRGYGQRIAAWADQQKARDFDAEESFPTGSPSVNVSSVAGLSGASSVNRGFGSGYRKRTSLTSGGQRQRQASPADAKVFNEPGGHG